MQTFQEEIHNRVRFYSPVVAMPAPTPPPSFAQIITVSSRGTHAACEPHTEYGLGAPRHWPTFVGAPENRVYREGLISGRLPSHTNSSLTHEARSVRLTTALLKTICERNLRLVQAHLGKPNTSGEIDRHYLSLHLVVGCINSRRRCSSS